MRHAATEEAKSLEPITAQQRDEFARELVSQRDLACKELGFTDRENLTSIQNDRKQTRERGKHLALSSNCV